MGHTPGPWGYNKECKMVIEERDCNSVAIVCDANVEDDGTRGTPMPCNDNGKLLAAAPDLLAALKATLPVIEAMQRMLAGAAAKEGFVPGGPVDGLIRAAIAKADGK